MSVMDFSIIWKYTIFKSNVFSLNAPIQPKNPIINTRLPVIRIINAGSNNTVFVKLLKPLSIDAYVPIEMNINPPN